MKKTVFLLMTLLVSLNVSTQENTYTLEVGEKDQERLDILDEIFGSQTQIFLDRHLKEGQTVLDVACGSGMCVPKIAKVVGKAGFVMGVDASNEQVEVARKKFPEHTFECCSLQNLEKLDKKFDVIFVRFLFYHLPDLKGSLEHLKKALNPGGTVIIIDVGASKECSSVPHVSAIDDYLEITDVQFKMQQSHLDCFFQLPALLEETGFTIDENWLNEIKLETPRKRSFLTNSLRSVRPVMVPEYYSAEKYDSMVQKFVDLETNDDVEVYFAPMGQIAAVWSGK